MIIALIVTVVWAVGSYYNVIKPNNEINKDMESKGAVGTTPELIDDIENRYNQYILVSIIVFLIVVFCITTVLSYIVIDKLIKR